MERIGYFVATMGAALFISAPTKAEPFFFSTGFSPDGKIATLSRPASAGVIQTETADDFVLDQPTSIDHASFIGQLPSGAPLASVSRVEIEFYHVFPLDSANPPSGNVPTRVNSPGDVEIGSATRDSQDGSLSAIPAILNTSFTVSNSVVNGIHLPNPVPGGEGPATGQEVQFNVAFNTPVLLPADHYFFRPEVELTDGNFLLLSAPKPLVPPATPFAPDLQAWIRNDDLAPDWLRIGTDIVGGQPAPTFNMEFSLSGQTVPEPTTAVLLGVGLAGLGLARRSERRWILGVR